jgi:dipeptidyl aminopeptidase/acylaminoacyl peptidase
MTLARCRRASLIFVLLISCSFAYGQKRSINEKDLFRFTWPANPQISPDGSQVAYTLVSVNEKDDRYETSLWVVSTDGGQTPRRLTNGPRDSQPRWSPDGKRLVFLRSAEKDGKPEPPQLFLLDFTGGEPRSLTSLPKGAGQPVWSPDGQRIAFTSSSTDEDIEKAKKPKSDKGEKERESDVRVISRAVYRFNGAGYLDPKRPDHIWVVQIPQNATESPTPKRITAGLYEEDEITWSPDGNAIYFVSTRVPEPYYALSEEALYSVPANGGEIKQVFKWDGNVGSPSLSRDGKRLAFRGQPNKPVLSYTQPDLFVVELGGNQPRNLTTALDFDISGGITGDQHPPRAGGGDRPRWTADGNSVVDTVTRQGRQNLERFDVATGKTTALTSGDHEVFAIHSNADASKLVFLVSTPTEIGDVYVLDANVDNAKPKRLTNVNEKLMSELKLTAPEDVWYTSFDGKKIHALVQHPPDFDRTKKYPLILNIHGGPHAAYGYTFFHEMQWMAAKGYVVLYPNPRGSTTYGQDFGNIIQYRYPGDDFKDLMAGVDELIKRGYIDEKRLGITGGSGGGVLTNWAVTQTDRFAAAVSQRSISDWASWWYTADFTQFQPFWFRGSPWEDKDFINRSPITFASRIKTPLMLIEGETDDRTPASSGGEQMFRALKYRKVPTVMVRFPGETHELSRSGKPWHRIERLQHIVNWFDIYLMGKPISGYENYEPFPATKKAE